ncbi:hypothetical protein NA57DRAFT_39709 [Rhizodiscina lignyota]|uniref:Gylcosyl hydrolase 115 C-terminal domain-containing protein n=1 Tax=Rhizodiscina lignyota TaxID=1504668 RepID=A0A9P4II53_9PEZI|nr:hypothetical protein NA57DRAFT_39709 [Rhizodiscina lignyota]
MLLASKSAAAQLMLDEFDWPGVLRAADDLAADFGRVTGVNGTVTLAKHTKPPVTLNASVIYNLTHSNTFARSGAKSTGKGGVIIAGTLGRVPLIDDLVKSKKIDVSEISGKWEAYMWQTVEKPMPGVDEALVLIGSDKRGTIYSLYDVSEQIGVSPWYWFADVPPRTKAAIYTQKNVRIIQGTPSVKYRGFFINDEAPALTGWMNVNYPKGPYGSAFIADFYQHVFELLLRLRANYFWPASWGSMFNVDDPRNQPLADEYGIVMGTSHTEPFMRATNEWTTFGHGPWQWNVNNESIIPFLRYGVERAKPYESIITMAMRGSGDTALSSSIETTELEDIVDTQREILQQVYGNLSVPQMWCLYKEVQAYYNMGMKVADDITLLWADDNWGNVRQLPVGNETERSGGAGVYFHVDYVGDPRNYKWINTVQLEKIWEQMNFAYQRDARDIWIVNVGDIKPEEIPISFFLDLAYDASSISANTVSAWTKQWSSQQWGPDAADDVADVIERLTKLSNLRKFEQVDENLYSVLNYNEADDILAQWQDLAADAQKINGTLPASATASYFEMVLQPALAGANLYDLYISTAKNQMYAIQGRNSANSMAARVLDDFNTDHQYTVDYNTLLNGKWNHMMDQTHIGYLGYWQQPMRQSTPGLHYVQTLERGLAGDMGVSVEASLGVVPGDDQYHPNSGESLVLPPMSPYGASGQRYIEIFNRGVNDFNWNISTDPFVKVSKAAGSISPKPEADSQTRIYITIDWDKCPPGSGMSVLNVSSSRDYGTQYSMPSVMIPYNHTSVPSSFKEGFVEDDAHISMDAAHYTRTAKGSGSGSNAPHYINLPNYGRTASGAMALMPVLAPSLSPRTAPALEYDFYTFTNTSSTKPANVTFYLSPSLNTSPKRPLKYAYAIDDGKPDTAAYVCDNCNDDKTAVESSQYLPAGWETAVGNNAWSSSTNATIPAGQHTLKFWALEPGVVLMKVVVDLGGVRPSYLGPPESRIIGK